MSLDLLAAVERAAVRGWPALATQDVGGWLWRRTSGGSIRANSVATLAFAGDAEQAITRCEDLYRERGAPCVFTISGVGEPRGLDALLEARGYQRGDDHVTMAKTVDADVTLPEAIAVGVRPTAGWMDVNLSGLSTDRRSAAPGLIAGLHDKAVFLAHQIDGCATTSGMTVIDGALASVQCMASLPSARRRGGARAVLTAIEAIAALNSVTHIYLQTSGDNTAARALYRQCGFADIGHYHTRTRHL